MNKKLLYIGCFFLCACATEPSNEMVSTIDDGELPALRLAERLRQDGNHASALNFYEKAMKNDPNNDEIKLSYAMSLRGNRSFGDARRVLLDLYKHDPNNRSVRIELARTYLEENKPQEALTYIEPLLSTNKQTDAAMIEAVSLDLLNQQDKAQEVYREILTKEPHNLRVQSNLALSLTISGDSEEAISILEDVTRSNHATIRDRHNLAIAYEKSGQREKAKQLWKMDLTAQEADETRQFFDSLNGETTIDTAAFDKATDASPIQEVALTNNEMIQGDESKNLAKFNQVQKVVPTPKPYKDTSKTAATKAKTPGIPAQTLHAQGEEPLTHLNGPVMDDDF